MTILLVAGPLLGDGYLLLLDAPTGPVTVWPTLLPLPSEGLASGGVPSSVFFRFPLALLHSIAPTAPNKVLLVGSLGGSVLSFFHLARRWIGATPMAAVAGAFFYAVNPFTYQRLAAGHLSLMVGYALVPLVIRRSFDLADNGSRRNLVRVLWLNGVVLLVSPHVGALTTIAVMAASLTGGTRTRQRLSAAGATVGSAVGTSAFWLLPAVFSPTGLDSNLAEIRAFSTKPSGWGSALNGLLLQGFWRDEFAAPLDDRPLLFLTFALVLGIFFAVGIAKLPRYRTGTLAAGLTALVLASSTSLPGIRSLARWVFAEIPGLQLFREPQKFLMILCLAYAIGISRGVDVMLEKTSRRSRIVVPALAAGSVLVASFPMLWGFQGQISTSSVPGGLVRATADLEADGDILYLPWHEFMPYGFAGGRTIGDLAPHLLGDRAFSSNIDGFIHRTTGDNADPRVVYVNELIERRGLVGGFGSLVAPLGIRYVFLAHTADFRAYRFLDRQEDLELRYAGAEATVYENLSWQPRLTTATRQEIPNLAKLFEEDASQDAAAEAFIEIPGRRPPLGGWGVAPARGDVEIAPDTFLITERSCRDGFSVAGEPSLCHLGAFATYARSGPLRNAYDLPHLAGLGMSLVTWLAILVARYAFRDPQKSSISDS